MKTLALTSAILDKMPQIGKWQRTFILHLIPLFLSIRGRINFSQMARYGIFSLTTYRNNFDKSFDFLAFNTHHVEMQSSGYNVILFDPSHINKSGKNTFQKGYFWSGCAKSMKEGLEISGIAIGDVDNHTAFHLEAVQTPNKQSLEADSSNLLKHYAQVIIQRKDTLQRFSNHMALDAYFSKKSFVDDITENTVLNIISRLRSDSVLQYLYLGEKTGKRGRPREYDGKVNIHKPDMNHFKIVHQDEERIIFSATVFAKALKRKIKLALVQYLDEDTGKIKTTKIYFSIDLDLSAWHIVWFYGLRFQIEFIYRDANQFTGLENSQARSEEKLHFHFNTALTTVSLAKSEYYLSLPKEKRKSFSMANVKTLYHNELLINRFFSVLGIDPNTHLNNPKIKELYHFGSIAA
jgi:hypothetical protein